MAFMAQNPLLYSLRFFSLIFFQIFATTTMYLGHWLMLNLHMDDIEFTFWLFKAIVHYFAPCVFFFIGFVNVSIILNNKYLTFIYFCIIPKTYTLNFLYEFCKPLKKYNSSTSDNNLPTCSFIVTTLQVQII
jgi:hypothetical protein